MNHYCHCYFPSKEEKTCKLVADAIEELWVREDAHQKAMFRVAKLNPKLWSTRRAWEAYWNKQYLEPLMWETKINWAKARDAK